MTSIPFAGTLRSPCVSVCRIEPATGYCEGCHRTIDEIADWGMMSDDRKRVVWQQIRLRRGVPDPTLPPGPLEPDLAPAQPKDRAPAQERPDRSQPPPPAVTAAPEGEGP